MKIDGPLPVVVYRDGERQVIGEADLCISGTGEVFATCTLDSEAGKSITDYMRSSYSVGPCAIRPMTDKETH